MISSIEAANITKEFIYKEIEEELKTIEKVILQEARNGVFDVTVSLSVPHINTLIMYLRERGYVVVHTDVFEVVRIAW